MFNKVLNHNDMNNLINNNDFLVIAGPCAIESEEMLIEMAKFLLNHGIHYMRAGAYKPRTSPYDFQGLGKEGLEILYRVKQKTGIKVVCEIVNIDDVDYYNEHIDIIQVGARNMQNFSLLKALGKLNKPILLKRSFGATIEEWLYACEYILNEGNQNVILCERGIKTFETMTRSTLDISSIPLIKSMTNIPIIVDPSHSAGRRDLILPLVKASIAVGADGVLVEVHPNPNCAKSDAPEQIGFEEFENILNESKKLIKIENKNVL